MQYKFVNGEFVLIKESVVPALERCREYVAHYQKLLKYTNHTVRRKNLMQELDWWKSELEEQQEMAKNIKEEEGRHEKYIAG